MGLDVHLYRFTGLDTDAILKLWQFYEEPDPRAYEEFKKWSTTPPSERGSYPSEKSKAEGRSELITKVRELGLPEEIVDDGVFGGTRISFPSSKHPKRPVGDWYSFSTVREMMQYFLGKSFYFVLPEAEGIHGLFRPHWAESRKRLAVILQELQKLKPKQIEHFHAEFVLPHISQELLKKLKPASALQIFESDLAQVEVMIETLDFVLNSGNPREFLLYWSD